MFYAVQCSMCTIHEIKMCEGKEMGNDYDDDNDEPKKKHCSKSGSHTWYNFVVQSKQCVCVCFS